MTVVAALLIIILGLLAAGQIASIVTAFNASTGTVWQRSLAAFDHSATILIARLMAFVGAFLAVGIDWLPVLDPNTQLGSLLVGFLNPKYVPYYTLVVALLTEVARRRASSVAPIVPNK